MAETITKREPNKPATHGTLKITSMGPLPDEADHGVTINEAHDGVLAYALAMRGYDVTLKEVPPSTIEKRKREHEAWKAKREARHG